MGKILQFPLAILRSPIVWGGLAAVGFYALVFGGPLGAPLILHYCAGHTVEYIEMGLFFIGLAVLVLKALDLLVQYPALAESPLGLKNESFSPAQSGLLLKGLDRLPLISRQTYFIQRLRSAIEHVQRRESAESLDDELKYLADVDAARLQSSYGLFRVVIWAIPILGFLGTVIGITTAIANLNDEGAISQVKGGLAVAFDTTTLALSLSIVLMMVQFLVDQAENRLLGAVDRRVAEELEGRFEKIAAGPDGQVVAVRRMAETMLAAVERLVGRQVELWQSAMDAAAARWTQMSVTAGERVQTSLSAALNESLRRHAEHLAAVEHAAAQHTRQSAEQFVQSQVQASQALSALQARVTRQTEVLQKAVEAAGEVAGLEHVLNQNLAALAGSKHFEQTVNSLAAAIHLLTGRLAESTVPAAPVVLDSPRRAAQAA
ncbi:MAG: MotA/TolQ/ExbB proton channel family protein [Pirellulales bacterium]|nr:MotA/TolQ/ExbB proton channel family protein [Pirellulales bacterium]